MIHGYHTFINSEWIARIAGADRITAKADRLWFRDGIPKRVLTLAKVREEISKKYIRE